MIRLLPILLIALLAGCGQKGLLYLPEQTPPMPPAAEPAPGAAPDAAPIVPESNR